jgi:hypothetical protein
MTSALHAEGREFNPPLEYFFLFWDTTEGRQWCIGNIEASQALAPGSTPGWRKYFFFLFLFFFLGWEYTIKEFECVFNACRGV